MWNHPTELHLYFMQQSIITVMKKQRRTSLNRILAYADKGNIISSKSGRSFLRNFFVICELLPQRYIMFQATVRYQSFWGSWEGLLWFVLRPTLIKEISSVQNVKEAFWETYLLSVNSSHRVTARYSGSHLLTLFPWNLQSEIWELLGAHGEKGNILR